MSNSSLRSRAIASLGLSAMADALAVKNFRIYILSNCASLIGLWVQRIAAQALTWSLTHSFTWLGIMALVDLAPALILGPVAGAMADRFDRRRLTYVTQWIAMGQATLLAVLTLAGLIDLWLLLALTAAGGVNTSFWGPVRQSIVPNLVPRKHLSTAVALGSLNFNLARFIGPAIAGPVILFAGIGAAFAVNAVSYLAFLVALSYIEIPQGPKGDPDKRTSLAADTVAGLKFVARHPGIGPLLIYLFLGGTALRPLIELLAGFADRVHDQGPAGFALLTSAMGGGALLASIWLAVASQRIDHLKTVIWSGILGGAVIVLLALAPTFPLAIVAITAASFAIATNGVGGQILLQLAVPDAMRGRVLSLYTAIFRGTPAIGALTIGALADHLGFRPPLAGAGLMAIAVFAWAALRQRKMAEHLAPREEEA